MRSLRVLVAVSVLALTTASTAIRAEDKDKDKVPASITVAFGAGLNTAQPGNTLNHHILPQEFTVRITKAKKLDGTVVFVPATVNFVVSGFHYIWVYNPGVTLAQVQANIPPAGTFVNYDVNVFAKGVNPGTPPAFADASVNPSGVQNRTDSVGFSVPGDTSSSVTCADTSSTACTRGSTWSTTTATATATAATGNQVKVVGARSSRAPTGKIRGDGVLQLLGDENFTLRAYGGFAARKRDPASQFDDIAAQCGAWCDAHAEPFQPHDVTCADGTPEPHPELETEHGPGPGIV